jgi:hypothetical protein
MTLRNLLEGLAVESKQLPDGHNVTVDNLPATQPVSAASLPLPSGASTASKQLADDHNVTVSNQIAQPVQDGGSVDVGNLPATYPNQHSQPLTDTQLRATAVPVSGTVTSTPSGTQNVDVTGNTAGLATSAKQLPDGHNVRDEYSAVEHEADQGGADAVLTFTLGVAADFLIVDADNTDTTDYTAFRCRATIDGTTPSATVGFVCRSGQSTYLPFPSGTTIKVYTPTGVVVAVQAGRY